MTGSKFILQESFSEFYKKEKSLQQLKEWYNYDIRCIDRIVAEGKLGDLVGGAVNKVKGFAKDKLMQVFVNLILPLIKKDPKKAQEVAAGLQDVAKNPQKLQANAAQANKILGGGDQQQGQQGQQQLNASYQYDNISFLIDSVFNESSLHELFELGVLTEARANVKGGKVQPPKVSRSLNPVVKQVVGILNSYKNPKTRQSTLDNFIRRVNKGLTPMQQQGAQAGQQGAAPQQAGQQQAGQSGQSAQSAQGAQGAQGAQPQAGQQGAAQQQQAGNPAAQATPQAGQQQAAAQPPAQQQGLFQKAISWVKSNPNMTAGAVIAVVSAIALATGGTAVLIPLIYKGLTGGAIAGGMSAIGQKAAGGKVDWKKAGSAALKGTAGGMALGGLGKLAGAAMGAGGGDDVTTDTENPAPAGKNALSNWDGQEQDANAEDQAYANGNEQGSSEAQYQQADQNAVDQDTGGQQQPQHSTTSEDPNGQETDADGTDGSVTDDEFKKFTGTNPDPKSYQDNAIKQAFQNLKSKSGGQLGFKDADKASEQIIKFIKANKGIKDPNQIIAQAVPWTLGESVYTSNYLKFF